MSEKTYHINDKFIYKRIGNTIYVLDEETENDILFEFDNEGFHLMRCMLTMESFSYPELQNKLLTQLNFEFIDEAVLRDFLNELALNGILNDK